MTKYEVLEVLKWKIREIERITREVRKKIADERRLRYEVTSFAEYDFY